MDFSRVQLGARIEFYEDVDGPDGRPTKYVGAATKDPAFASASVPNAGDRVSILSLGGGGADGAALGSLIGGSPFVRVAYVEHFPIPLDDAGEIASWWSYGFTTPSANVVFHVQAVRDGGYGRTLAQTLTDQGWSVGREVFAYAGGPDRSV